MSGGQYQVLYVDTMTGAVHGVLPVSELSFKDTLNGAGAITASMPLDSASSARLTNQVSWDRVEANKLEPDGSTQLWVLRDNVPVWAGFVWTREVNPEANAMTVSGEGFLSYFRRRHIYLHQKFTGTDQAAIAEELIEWAQSRTGGDVNVYTAGQTTGVTRDRYYIKTDYKSVGEAIEQLAAVKGGFDFRFRPYWDSGSLAVEFVVDYPAGGRATEMVLELGTNVNMLSERADGTGVATTTRATGVGTGNSMLRKAHVDTSQLGTRPLLDSVRSYSDVSVASTLQAHADLDAIRASRPLSHVDVELLAGTLPGIGSYVVGDRVRLKGGHGYWSVDSTYRITEQQVQVSDGGEAARLSLAPLEVFL